jgi:hypothetical protein
MQPGSRAVVGVTLAEAGIEDEGARDDASGQMAQLGWQIHRGLPSQHH